MACVDEARSSRASEKSSAKESFVIIKGLFLAVFAASAALASESVNTQASLDGWGIEAGFGQQAFMKDQARVGVLSPTLFSWRGSNARIVFQYLGMALQASPYNNESLSQTSINFELDSPLCKDITSVYVRVGYGLFTLSGILYDGLIQIAPMSLGINIVTSSVNQMTLSFFVEYSFNVWNNFNGDKSVPPLHQANSNVTFDKTILFQGSTLVGVRFFF